MLQYVWRSEDNLPKSVLSFYHVGTRDGTPAGGGPNIKSTDPLSHLANSLIIFEVSKA